jgi:hypothetical protein
VVSFDSPAASPVDSGFGFDLGLGLGSGQEVQEGLRRSISVSSCSAASGSGSIVSAPSPTSVLSLSASSVVGSDLEFPVTPTNAILAPYLGLQPYQDHVRPPPYFPYPYPQEPAFLVPASRTVRDLVQFDVKMGTDMDVGARYTLPPVQTQSTRPCELSIQLQESFHPTPIPAPAQTCQVPFSVDCSEPHVDYMGFNVPVLNSEEMISIDAPAPFPVPFTESNLDGSVVPPFDVNMEEIRGFPSVELTPSASASSPASMMKVEAGTNAEEGRYTFKMTESGPEHEGYTEKRDLFDIDEWLMF